MPKKPNQVSFWRCARLSRILREIGVMFLPAVISEFGIHHHHGTQHRASNQRQILPKTQTIVMFLPAVNSHILLVGITGFDIDIDIHHDARRLL
jgi:hypothetical protein